MLTYEEIEIVFITNHIETIRNMNASMNVRGNFI